MSTAARWSLFSATCAPVSLVTGMCLGAQRQPERFDSLVDTISALAALGATARVIMTTALVVLGLCHVLTALGLKPAALAGRLLLALGGVATVLVAVFPLPAQGTSLAHFAVAAVAFGSLAVWPFFAALEHASHVMLSRRVCLAATLLLSGLLVCFATSLWLEWYVGASERVVAVAQALWPLLVVLDTRREADAQPRAHGH